MNGLHWVQYYDSIKLIYIWRFKQTEFHYLFHIPFNYLDSDIIPFNFHLEDGERCFESCYDEHDWFIPDFTRNNRGRWCPNICSGFNYFGFPTVKCDSTGITLSTLCTEVNIICIWPYIQCQSAPPPPCLEVYENHKVIICILFNHFKGNKR